MVAQRVTGQGKGTPVFSPQIISFAKLKVSYLLRDNKLHRAAGEMVPPHKKKETCSIWQQEQIIPPKNERQT